MNCDSTYGLRAKCDLPSLHGGSHYDSKSGKAWIRGSVLLNVVRRKGNDLCVGYPLAAEVKTVGVVRKVTKEVTFRYHYRQLKREYHETGCK